jgi:hypothetical protein
MVQPAFQFYLLFSSFVNKIDRLFLLLFISALFGNKRLSLDMFPVLFPEPARGVALLPPVGS